MSGPGLAPDDIEAPSRGHVSSLHALFVLSMMMFTSRESEEILRLCASSVGSLGPLQAEAAYVAGAGSIKPVEIGQPAPAGLRTDLAALGPAGGSVDLPGREWAWSFPFVGLSGCRGYLVISAARQPTSYERFLLDVLVRQTAAALENAGLYRSALEHAQTLRLLKEEREAVNRELRHTVEDLERRTRTHELLTRASLAADVSSAVASALHDLTGLAAAVEDRFGNILEWAAAVGTPTYDPLPDSERAELSHAVMAGAGRPVRDGRRLVALARPGNETLGAVVLLDPDRVAGDYELFALEHASTVVGMALAHRRSLVEVELRMRRQLIDDLLTGTDDGGVMVRATAVGHDLRGLHRVVVLRWPQASDEDVLVTAAERAATQLELKALVARRAANVVLVVGGDVDGPRLYELVSTEVRSRHGAIGIGGPTEGTSSLPRSFDEAQRALELRSKSRSPYGVTAFDDLGIYRILAGGERGGEIDVFVRQWLGRLLDYDHNRHATLVETLAEYLDCGGNYDLTAETLLIHRSTLRYRLRRIRELTGLELSDVDNRLNLHVATRAWRVLDDT
ncbi:MAG: transcriptional regulator [Frankiales bacterium]|nr:transcriptional regulator [Frankiales bacterium]